MSSEIHQLKLDQMTYDSFGQISRQIKRKNNKKQDCSKTIL